MEKSEFFKKIKKYKKIAIISHDAGGAEILSSLCTTIKQKKKYYLKGPAKKIFKKNLKKKILNSKKKEVISWSDLIITSTSVNSDLEKKFIDCALLNNKNVISILDHWVNYYERFFFKKKLLKPTEIWTVDKEAQALAKNIFSRKIYLLNNFYLKNLKKNKFLRKKNKFVNFLFASDNIDGKNKTSHDIKVFKKFLKKFKKIKTLKPKKLFFKTHPSEKNNKYEHLFKTLEFKIFKCKKNFDIREFDYVAAHQSMMLVVGKNFGLKTINIKIKKSERIFLPKKYIDSSIF